MKELNLELVPDNHARTMLLRLKARVARRPGRWRRRMARHTRSPEAKHDLARAA